MKNAQPHTNAEPSALVQRDISRYRVAIQAIECFSLAERRSPLSPKGVIHRWSNNLLPHSFLSVGDGVHVIPISSDRTLLGFPPSGIPATPGNLIRRRDYWLPEWGIDRSYLILGNFLYPDIEWLTGRSQEGRKLFALRVYGALRHLGFPKPQGEFRNAESQLRAEIAARGGAI